MTKLFGKLLITTLFLAVAITSCTINPETLPEPRKIVKPKIGSIFKYVSIQTDSNGAKVPGSLEDTTVLTVVNDTMKYKNKTNVRMLVSAKGDTLYQWSDSTKYAEYETSRDSVWVEYPILLPINTKLNLYSDVSYPNKTRYKVTDTLEKIGETLLNYKGENYTAVKIARKYWQRTYRDTLLQQTTQYNSDYVFAYKIGSLTSISSNIKYTTNAATTKRGFIINLIDFTLVE